MPPKNQAYKIPEILDSLTFDEYVIIDYLKLNDLSKVRSYYSYCYTLNFIAVSKQGFLNVFKELLTLLNLSQPENQSCHIILCDNQICIHDENLTFVIRYVTDKQKLKELIDLPGLDFYKCYYDGTKAYCTPEALRCHKTKRVRYYKKINLILPFVRDMFALSDLTFDDNFWKETNKEYFYPDVSPLSINIKMLIIEYLGTYERFPTKADVLKKKTLFGSKYMFKFWNLDFEGYEKRVYKFIEEVIFENPISTLC
jgi:hypothetical protein